MGSFRKYFSNAWVAVSSAVLIAVVLIGLLLFIVFRLKDRAVDSSYESAVLISKDIKHTIELHFRDAYLINSVFTDNFLIYRKNNIPRTKVYSMIKGSLQIKPNLLSIWTMWERNGYDRKDRLFASDSLHDAWGSFAFAYYYYQGRILFEKNDTADYKFDFYTIPARIRRPILIDPFHYQYQGNPQVYFETSLVNPILSGDTLLGVIGIDINLSILQEKYRNIRLYNTGFVSVLSNSGKIVTHPDSSVLDKNLVEQEELSNQAILDSMKLGKEFLFRCKSAYSQTDVVRFFYPINMEYMVAPWYVMVEIPEKEIFSNIRPYRLLSYFVLGILLLLLLFLVLTLVATRQREKEILQALQRAETSEVQLTKAREFSLENEQILNAIFNQSSNLIGLLSRQGVLLRANEVALDMINSVPEDVTGKFFWEGPWWNQSREKEKLKSLIKSAAEGISGTFETTHTDASGNTHFIMFSIKPVFSEAGDVKYLLPEGVDITSRKIAEQRLKEGEEKYRAIFNNANDAIFLMDGHIFIDCNDKTLKIFNCKRDDIVGKDPILFSPERQEDGRLSSELAGEKIMLAFNNEPQFFEWQHITRDGKLFNAEVSLTKVVIQEKELILAIVRDISERMAYEKVLKASRERLRATLQNTPNVAIQWYSRSGQVLLWNKASEKIFGYSSDEALGQTLDKLIYTKTENDEFLKLLQRLEHEGNSYGPYEGYIRTRDGDTRIILSTTFVIPGEEKDNVFVCMDLDITEQKRAEAAMKESEERYRTMVEAFPDFIMVSDLDGKILFNNEKLEGAGEHHQSLNDTSAVKDRMHPDDYIATNKIVEEMLESEESNTPLIEFRLKVDESRYRWFSGIFSRITFQGKKALQLVMRDIHEKKKAETELSKYRNQLEALVKERTDELEAINEELRATNDEVFLMNEDLEGKKTKLEETLNKLQEAQNQLVQSEKLASLGVFTAGIAHEINNPINFISNGAQALFLILEEARKTVFKDGHATDVLFEEISASRRAIDTGIQRTTAIISSLRNYAHAGKESFILYNSIHCINDALILLKNSYKYHINIIANLPEVLNIECIPGKINQIFVNLISNSIHAIERAGEIHIDAKTEGDKARFRIRDNGSGILPEVIGKIFDPFFTTKDVGKGTGLGLYIVHGIIEQHHGSIEVKSTPGKGTIFTIWLPLHQPTEAD
ncbi:MAG: PAS domain S-box protein [Bacteroidales bacterium]